MIRTQIQLPDELYRRAKRVAEQREISLAEMTRRGLELFLARIAPATTPRDGWEMPALDGGGIHTPLEQLRDLAAGDEARRAAGGSDGRSPEDGHRKGSARR